MTLMVYGLGLASAQESQPINELSRELVSSRLQTLRDSGSQEGTETTIGSYEAVLNWLGEAEVPTERRSPCATTLDGGSYLTEKSTTSKRSDKS